MTSPPESRPALGLVLSGRILAPWRAVWSRLGAASRLVRSTPRPARLAPWVALGAAAALLLPAWLGTLRQLAPPSGRPVFQGWDAPQEGLAPGRGSVVYRRPRRQPASAPPTIAT